MALEEETTVGHSSPARTAAPPPGPDSPPPAGRPAALLAALRRRVTGPRPPVWMELTVIVWLSWIYDDINNLSPLRVGQALANGRFLLHVETTLHLDPEAFLDHWLAGHRTLGWIAGTYYDNAHFVTTFGMLILLWWKFPSRYRPLRNGLVLTNLAAMLVFWTEPTAPPRLIDPSRFIDIVGQSHSFGSWHTGALATAADQLAAMPSMHLGWAAWSAYAAWCVLPRGRARWLVWLYPALTAATVLATGNHYVLDVVGGVVVFALSQMVAERWSGWWAAREAHRALTRANLAAGGDHS